MAWEDSVLFAARALMRFAVGGVGVSAVLRLLPTLAAQLENTPLRPWLRAVRPSALVFAAFDLTIFFVAAAAIGRTVPSSVAAFRSNSAWAAVAVSHHVLCGRLSLLPSVAETVAAGVNDCDGGPLFQRCALSVSRFGIAAWIVHHVFTSSFSRLARLVVARHEQAHPVGAVVRRELTAASLTAALSVGLFAALSAGIRTSVSAPIAIVAVTLWRHYGLEADAVRAVQQTRRRMNAGAEVGGEFDADLAVREESLAQTPVQHLPRLEELARLVVQAQRVRHSARAAALRFLAACSRFRTAGSHELPAHVENALRHTTFAEVHTASASWARAATAPPAPGVQPGPIGEGAATPCVTESASPSSPRRRSNRDDDDFSSRSEEAPDAAGGATARPPLARAEPISPSGGDPAERNQSLDDESEEDTHDTVVTVGRDVEAPHDVEAVTRTAPAIFDATSCAICYDDFTHHDPVSVVRCGHIFHTACLRAWLLPHRTDCPICRGAVCDLEDALAAMRVDAAGATAANEAVGARLALWATAALPARVERGAWGTAVDLLTRRGFAPRADLLQLPTTLRVARGGDGTVLLYLVLCAAGIAPKVTMLL